ncbi:MAG: P-loop NTPase fold protein [Burkholderiaceae bacterium]
MQAPGPTTAQAGHRADSGAGTADPRDWLNYRTYANTLWQRIEQHFLLAEATLGQPSAHGELPTGDPMVVGVYGEWGVGKSRLLELLYEHAAEENARECELRALDPQAWASSQALRLTVPVWFHPWKYEHEPHLAVPLLMHIAEAAQRSLGDAQSLQEQTEARLRAQGRQVADALKRVREGAEWFQKVAKVAHGVAGNDLVKTTASLAAGYFGMAPVAARTLSWIETSAKRFLPGQDAQGDKDEAGKPAPARGWLARFSGAAAEAVAEATPAASADGRYYYGVHRYLRDIARITPERSKQFDKNGLAHEIRLNFVVFVDDLDRCLPEKAVEVLEVVKTVLNVEHFAFVMALDDEVIERGISHRYRDYRFEKAQTEMPITGFEYLEKIVHLPFRLPQLTRAQALTFMRRQEERLLARDGAGADALRLWFAAPSGGTEGAPSGLAYLLLDSFDAYVPRKLARTLELMHQVQRVLQGRGRALTTGTLTGTTPSPDAADARMMLFCVLMQLFAPEIFRLLRRRPEIFGHWMRAYLMQDEAHEEVFEWQKTEAGQVMTLEVPDTDLFRWVALGSRAGRLRSSNTLTDDAKDKLRRAPTGADRRALSAYQGLMDMSSTDRYSVEQTRLPLALALTAYRDMQRHAFSPLRLGAAMAFATGWTSGSVARLQDYLHLFGDELSAAPPAATPVPPVDIVATAVPPSAMPASMPVPAPVPSPAAAPAEPPVAPIDPAPAEPPAPPTTRPVRTVSVGRLMELLGSGDASTRAAVVDRLNLQPGEVIDAGNVRALVEQLQRGGHSIEPRRVLEGLGALAPFIEPAALDGTAEGWGSLVKDWQAALRLPGLDDEVLLAIARPVATLSRLGLLQSLGAQPLGDEVRDRLVAAASETQSPRPLAWRAEAADLVGCLGDEAFHFDELRAHLPARRAKLTGDREPVAGFVRLPMRRVPVFGIADPPMPRTVFMGRTLVTVQQYANFVQSGGYDRPDGWDADGQDWRQGRFDERLGQPGIVPPTPRRPALRHQPMGWTEQLATPTRPVRGLTWFEARAYARWLDFQMRDEIWRELGKGYAIGLMVLGDWQRGAGARSPDEYDTRGFPWGETHSSAEALPFNFDVTRLGRPNAVGLFPPNPLQLHDVVGNLWSWTDMVLGGVAGVAPMGPAPTGAFVPRPDGGGQVQLLGGAYDEPPVSAGLAPSVPRGLHPWLQADNVGLRLVLRETGG